MNKLFKDITIWSLIIVLLTILIIYYFYTYQFVNYFRVFPLLPILFYVFGIIAIVLAEGIEPLDSIRFNVYFLGFTTIKFLTTCLLVVVYHMKYQEHLKTFVAITITYYFVLLTYEIITFVKKIKK